jgi:hypothetical protein
LAASKAGRKEDIRERELQCAAWKQGNLPAFLPSFLARRRWALMAGLANGTAIPMHAMLIFVKETREGEG